MYLIFYCLLTVNFVLAVLAFIHVYVVDTSGGDDWLKPEFDMPLVGRVMSFIRAWYCFQFAPSAYWCNQMLYSLMEVQDIDSGRLSMRPAYSRVIQCFCIYSIALLALLHYLVVTF